MPRRFVHRRGILSFFTTKISIPVENHTCFTINFKFILNAVVKSISFEDCSPIIFFLPDSNLVQRYATCFVLNEALRSSYIYW